MIRWIRQTETNIVELMKTYHISGNQTKGQKWASPTRAGHQIPPQLAGVLQQNVRRSLVCEHFLHVSSAIIGKHRFLDKASIQPQQTSDHQTNIVQQVMSTGGEFYGQNRTQIRSIQMQTPMLTESLR